MAGTSSGTAGATARSDRTALLSALGALVALSWLYLFHESRAIRQMDMADMAMPASSVWGASELLSVFVMWVVMMVAMMLPTVTPMVLLFATVNRKYREQKKPFVRTSVFVAGYLSAWVVFSVTATLAQWGMQVAALASPMMVVMPTIGGALLIAAGIYQWTPLKHACLAQCRSPLEFVMTRWRKGPWGAFRMGVDHGLFCLGCCWLLMTLLFVVGVMNLIWIAVLSIFMLLEKVASQGTWLAKGSGVILAGWGCILIVIGNRI